MADVECPYCHGKVRLWRNCITCNGNGEEICTPCKYGGPDDSCRHCRGSGSYMCRSCRGSGQTSSICSFCHNGYVKPNEVAAIELVVARERAEKAAEAAAIAKRIAEAKLQLARDESERRKIAAQKAEEEAKAVLEAKQHVFMEPIVMSYSDATDRLAAVTQFVEAIDAASLLCWSVRGMRLASRADGVVENALPRSDIRCKISVVQLESSPQTFLAAEFEDGGEIGSQYIRLYDAPYTLSLNNVWVPATLISYFYWKRKRPKRKAYDVLLSYYPWRSIARKLKFHWVSILFGKRNFLSEQSLLNKLSLGSYAAHGERYHSGSDTLSINDKQLAEHLKSQFLDDSRPICQIETWKVALQSAEAWKVAFHKK